MKNRRTFLSTAAAGGMAVIGLIRTEPVHAQAMVAETDPQAASLGYKADTAQVDQKKFPKHTAEQKCSNCQLYQSKSPTAGSCAIFPGKLVAGPGWCNAYQKKA